MAFTQGDADLRVVLEAADAGPVARARVDDDVRTPLGIDGHAFGRDDAYERVVDRVRERAAVDDGVVGEVQDRRQAFPRVLDEVIAALADRVPEQDRSLCGVDGIVVPVRPDARGGRGMGQHRAQVVVEGLLKLLGQSAPAPPCARFWKGPRPS